MKLIKLTLENFRQFYGKQDPIRFSNEKNKNVTIIFGGNGAGKSAILNAFTWTLYKKTSPSFEKPQNIVSEQAILGAKIGTLIQARVSLEFEHNGKSFIASRTAVVKKVEEPDKTETIKEGELQLIIIGTDGKSEESNHPTDHIEQVLPSQLHDFFFFDGERIEKLAKDSAYKEVAEAIKNILGIQILDRSIDHLKSIKGTLDNEFKDVGSVEVQNIIDNIKTSEKQYESENTILKDELDNVSAIKENIEVIKDRLRNLEETQALQEQLDEHETGVDQLKESINQQNIDIKTTISNIGYSAFIIPIIDKATKLLEEMRVKRELPSGIKKQFVQDLLDDYKCICGTQLKTDNLPNDRYMEVERWLELAGSSDVEQHAIEIGGQIGSLREKNEELLSILRDFLKSKSTLEAQVRVLEEKILELNRILDKKDSEEIQQLVDRKKELQEDLNQRYIIIGSQRTKIEHINQELEKLEKQKNEAHAADETSKLIQRKLRVRQETYKFFESIQAQISNEVRVELDERVRDVYKSISYKNFWTEITDDYRLVLKKGMNEEVSRTVAKSTGESQITSLSFIASISDYARKLTKEDGINRLLGFEGGIYPLIMDSPFGNLDDNYRESVSKGIPKLAEQVIILVSKSQGNEVVMNQLEQLIGKSYVIAFHTTKEEDFNEETISYSGRSYPYILKSSNKIEKAQIIEMK